MRAAVTISLVPEAKGGPFVFWDDLEAGCRQAAELGFPAVEIFAPSGDAVDRPLLRRLLSDLNLAVAAVGTGAGWVKHRLHLALPAAAERQRAVDFIRGIIDFGAEFAAPAIIGSMQGRSGGEIDHTAALGHLADGLHELATHASRQGMGLLYEPLNRYETDQAVTLASATELLGRVAADNLRILADLFHMNIEESDLPGALRAAGSKVGHVHFADSNRRAVGMGQLAITPVVTALRAIGYAGYLSAEVLPLPTSQAAAKQTMRAFQFYVGH